MKMREFIKANRAELESIINRQLNYVPATASCNCHFSGTNHVHEPSQKLTASDIEDWINNDESLYRWARREGVRV